MGGTVSVFSLPSFYDDPSKSSASEILIPNEITPVMDISGKESCASEKRKTDEDEAREAPVRLSMKEIFATFDDDHPPEISQKEGHPPSPMLAWLFQSDFLMNQKKLTSNSIETGIFLRFLFKQLWRNIIFPEIKYDLLQQTLTYLNSTRRPSSFSNSHQRSYHGTASDPGVLDSNDDYNESFPTSPSPKNPSFDKGSAVFAYFTMEQLQSILLGVTLSCFFQYRSSLDFAANSSVDREELLNSLFIDGSALDEYSTKNAEFRQSLIDQGYYDGYTIRDIEQQQLVVDPEDIFNMILRQSLPEDFEYLLGNSEIWMNHYVEAISQFPSTFTLWKVSNFMISKSHNNNKVLSIEYANKHSCFSAEQDKIQNYLNSFCSSNPSSSEDISPSLPQKILREFHEQVFELFLPMKLSLTVSGTDSLDVTHTHSTPSLPVFFSFLPIIKGCNLPSVYDDESPVEMDLLSIHCPLHQLHQEPFFFPVVDFLFFSIAGLKQPVSHYNV
jgi:hypothetical protein